MSKPSFHVWFAGLVLLAGCASGPPVPDWQADAHAAQQLAFSAELDGNTRVAQAEWRRAREAVARTAQPALVARMELSRCAVQQAALGLQPCQPFQLLAVDAAPGDSAYMRYLEGHPLQADIVLLPPAYQPVAQALLQPVPRPAGQWAETLQQQSDPLARLVAASVLVRTGRSDAAVLQLAVDTASGQGWRRPLLAWLTLQAQTARQAGQTELADRAERRRALLLP